MANQFSMDVPLVKPLDVGEIIDAQTNRQKQQMLMEEMQDRRATRNAMRNMLGFGGGSDPESLMRAGRQLMAISPDEGLKLMSAASNMAAHQQQAATHQSNQAIQNMTALSRMAQSVKFSADPERAWESVKSTARSWFGQLPPQFEQPYSPQLVDLAIGFTSNALEQQKQQLGIDQARASIAHMQNADAREADLQPLRKQNLQSEVDARNNKRQTVYVSDPNDPLGEFGDKKIPAFVDPNTGVAYPLGVGAASTVPGAAPAAPRAPAAPVQGTPVQISPQENFSANGFASRVPVTFGGGRAKGGKIGNSLRDKVKFCGGRADGGSATKDLSQANSGGNALNMTVVGERGPEIVLLPSGSEGYVLPITDKHANELLAWGAPGRADGGGMGGDGDNDNDAEGNDNDSAASDPGVGPESNDGGLRGDVEGGYDPGGEYADGSVDTAAAADQGGPISQQFADAYAASPDMWAQANTPAETMDAMDPGQRAGYAANVDAVNSTPFGDFSVDNTPQSQASSMFGNALKAQVEQQQNLAKEQQQAATMLGYQQNPTGPNYGALFAGDPNARATSNFGMRDHPIDGVAKMHNGIDIAAAKGSHVTASTNGEVTFAGTKQGYGNVVEMQDENGNKYTFGHLGNLGVKTGDRISAGTVLGQQGRTGKATGDHLHYGVTDNTGRQVNPATFHGWGG